MSTLISFLGKGQNSSYRTANYRFEDGSTYETNYIGLALADKIKPSRLVLLGTAGSMWDVFFAGEADNDADQWIELSEAVQTQSVHAAQLKPFEVFLQDKLGISVECVLIPFAKDTAEQIAILSQLADLLQPRERITLGVAHGFRHLPMLALVAARFLQTIKKVQVDHIYYGALEMTDVDSKLTPVLTLDGLLQMLDWVDALSSFDHNGDYAVFSKLLTQQGLEQNDAQLLEKASFFERTNNAPNAKQSLGTIFKKLETVDTPIFTLFKPQLLDRVTWIKAENRGLCEQQLAKKYLHQRDYLRATIYAQEGMISKRTHDCKEDTNNYDARLAHQEILKQNDDFRLFTNLRNALVHGLGGSAKKDVQRILSSEQAIKDSLRDRFENLLD